MAPNVKYTKKGDIHTIDIGLPGIEQIVIDYTNIPADQRSGLAKQLLAAANLSCYIAALDASLVARGATAESIVGEVQLGMGPNAVGQGRVKRLNLDVVTKIDEDSADIFDRCAKIMRQGCLVTGSLNDSIEVTYDLKADYGV